VKPLNLASEGALIMFIFYTVNPEPELQPKSFIVRVFKEQDDESCCVKTVSFPICNPSMSQKTKNEAAEFGCLYVKQLMDKELSYDGYRN
ncbi:hypothetical protein, partial [Neisseria sp. N95_16]